MILRAPLLLSLLILIPKGTNGHLKLYKKRATDLVPDSRKLSSSIFTETSETGSYGQSEGSFEREAGGFGLGTGSLERPAESYGITAISLEQAGGFDFGVESLGETKTEEGWVGMEGKLDLREVFQKLSAIPAVLTVLRNLTSRIEYIDKEFILKALSPQLTSMADVFGSSVQSVKHLVNDMFQHLQDGPLNSTENKLTEVLQFLRIRQNTKFKCDLREIENGIEQFANTADDKLTEISRLINTELTKDEEGLLQLKNNGRLLDKIYNLMNFVHGKTEDGFGSGLNSCDMCMSMAALISKGKENNALLKKILDILHTLPNEIVTIIMSDAGLGGIRSEIQHLKQAEEGVKAGLGQLASIVDTLSKKVHRYFTAHQKIIIDTQHILSETSRNVKQSTESTAAAVRRFAMEAARAAPRGVGKAVNCKNDFDDSDTKDEKKEESKEK